MVHFARSDKSAVRSKLALLYQDFKPELIQIDWWMDDFSLSMHLGINVAIRDQQNRAKYNDWIIQVTIYSSKFLKITSDTKHDIH